MRTEQKNPKVLLNKTHFADYNREIDVPGSKLLKGFVERGQLRLITVDVEKPGAITKITLESFDNGILPVVVAITVDQSAEPAAVKTESNAGAETSSVKPEELPADSIAALGQTFLEPRKRGRHTPRAHRRFRLLPPFPPRLHSHRFGNPLCQ